MAKWFIGIDWATEEHQISVVDAEGKEVDRYRVRHDGEDMERFVSELLEHCQGRTADLAVAIETTANAIIEALLEHGIGVFALNPKQLDRFRDRHSVSGAKDDRRDAYVLANSLRTDTPLFRKIELGDPVLLMLKEISRGREELCEEVIALGNRLTEHVRRYFPQMLELGSFHTDAWMLELFDLAPKPELVRHLKRAKVDTLLRRYHVRRIDADVVLATLRKKPLPVAPGVVDAASEHARMVLPLLKTALDLKRQATHRLEKLLDELSAPKEADEADDAGPKLHRDAAILLSLPGAGSVIGATMLAEASIALAARDYHGLRKLCGIAPVTIQTGKQKQNGKKKPIVALRRACHHRLRNCMHNWAGVAIQYDPRLRVQYARLRAAGHNHARSLRGVSDRLLAMLVAMLRTASVYDETKRTDSAAPTMPRRARRRAEEPSHLAKAAHSHRRPPRRDDEPAPAHGPCPAGSVAAGA